MKEETKEKLKSLAKTGADVIMSAGVGAAVTVGLSAILFPKTRGLGKALTAVGVAGLSSVAIDMIHKDNENIVDTVATIKEYTDEMKAARQAIERAEAEGIDIEYLQAE